MPDLLCEGSTRAVRSRRHMGASKLSVFRSTDISIHINGASSPSSVSDFSTMGITCGKPETAVIRPRMLGLRECKIFSTSALLLLFAGASKKAGIFLYLFCGNYGCQNPAGQQTRNYSLSGKQGSADSKANAVVFHVKQCVRF